MTPEELEPEAVPEPPKVAYASMNLIPPLMEAVRHAGYVYASPVQAAVIPEAMKGIDVIGQAQTGTGKTAAFLLPFMNRWRGGDPSRPQALVLTPTRELALQVSKEAEKLSPSRHFRTVAVYGGTKFGRQSDELQKGCTLVVGTPGRILDHLSRGTLNLAGVRYAVLDEADRMLDIGFRPQIERVLRRVPDDRQTLLMSATMTDTVKRITSRYMKSPIHINMSPDVLTVDKIDQKYYTVDQHRKLELLFKLVEHHKPRQCIIFVERKRDADALERKLRPTLPSSAAIHGDLQQSRREKILAAFRAGKLQYMIATDVMSRGIDVSGISHIVNFDLPNDLENYVHRIGRTGRMGKDGIAWTFVTPEQGGVLTEIEMLINREIAQEKIEGFEAVIARPPRDERSAPPAEPVKPIFGRPTKRYSNRL